ncbi:MAG: hypothetical protein M5U27_03240 [Gaiella sp.]|nr:hypothetical protein [Gaiella sp.]
MKKRKTPGTRTPEYLESRRAQHERTQRMLAERIAYHEARIAERERAAGESAAGAA